MSHRIFHGHKDKRWPESLPNDWVFPAPPTSTYYWSQADWVRYAAPYNKAKWEGNDDSL